MRALDGGGRLCDGLLAFCGNHRGRRRRFDRLRDNERLRGRLDGDRGRNRLDRRRLEHDLFDRRLGCRFGFDCDVFDGLGRPDCDFDELGRRRDRRNRRHRLHGCDGRWHRCQRPDLQDEIPGRRQALAGVGHLAHPVQLVERTLQHVKCSRIGRRHARFDRGQERFDLVTQVAHGADARHAGTALERVQQSLELGDLRVVRSIGPPASERRLGLFEQLGRFLAEDRRDVRVEVLAKAGFVVLRHWQVDRRRGRFGRRDRRQVQPRGQRIVRSRVVDVWFVRTQRVVGHLRQRRVRKLLGRHCRRIVDDHGQVRRGRHARLPGLRERTLRRGGKLRELRVELQVQRQPTCRQARLLGEETGVLIDVLGHCLEQPHGVVQQLERVTAHAVTVVEELADVVLHRLGDLDALARTGRLGDAAQRMAGAIERFRHQVRRDAAGAALEELAHDQDVTGGFLAEDFAQHRIHGRLFRRGCRSLGRSLLPRRSALAGAQALR